MKQQAANIYIALVAALGVIVLITNSFNVHTSSIDPVMFIFILVLVGIAQRNPVVLFRSSAISVAFAVKIAAYVLFGTPLALWATIVVVAVNAYTPKPKPARKVVFNFGQLMLATYLASSTYQLVGGMVPPVAPSPSGTCSSRAAGPRARGSARRARASSGFGRRPSAGGRGRSRRARASATSGCRTSHGCR